MKKLMNSKELNLRRQWPISNTLQSKPSSQN